MAKTKTVDEASTKKSFNEQDLLPLTPLTKTQKALFRAYGSGYPVIANVGSAGTGKTLVSMYLALREVLEKSRYYQLIIVRSCVPSREQGFLPGSLEEKESVYQQPYQEACQKLFNVRNAYQRLKELGYIQFVSTSFLRGLTFDNAIVLVDEVQNFTFEEAATVMTRMGEHSKIIFCGDGLQTDLYRRRTDQSGFADFMDVLRVMDSAYILEFEPRDIVRSGVVKEFLLACEKTFN